ncbi:MAG TPA: hypothetical protein VME46_12755 [Acidimicrobiales bacterium]|nr:hypothetical protein [Acidimicrobiales bacterium]
MSRTSQTGETATVAARTALPAHGAKRRRRSTAARGLFAAVLALASVGAASVPSGAGAQDFNRHFRPPTTTTTTTTSLGGSDTTTTTPGATTTVPTMPVPAPPPAVAPDNCVKGNWAPQFDGRPSVFQSGVNAVYLWHDPDGAWALRVTHANPNQRVVFSGSLYSAVGQFVDVTPFIASGGNDIIYETGDRHTVDFRLVDLGLLDGISFGTLCARAFTVNIHVGARLVPPRDVYLGANAVSAASNPFRATRGRDASGSAAAGKTTKKTPG